MSRKNLGSFLWIATVSVMAAGLIALYSAAYQNVRVAHKVFFDQLFGAGLGVLLLWFLARLDYRKFYDIAYVLYGVMVSMLVLVLVAGRHALGAQRWFSILGVSFQPSELMKLALILALGRYFSDRRSPLAVRPQNITQILWHDLIVPFLLTGLPMLLVFKQPDLGTAILLFGIFIIMLVVSGLRYRFVMGFLLLCLSVVPLGWHVLKAYQKDRLLVFLNPNIDPLGAGYTIIQSKIAIGSGMFLGKGWLSGTQNQLNFLPERHTDFIFSTIGEEWGFLGAMFLLICYFIIIDSGLKVAEQVKDRFGMLTASGCVGIIALQVTINIGMVLGLCPVVGITLPLVSYGRSSFFIFVIMIGFLLSLSRRRTVF
jgi:rod shape determining protein RodA